MKRLTLAALALAGIACSGHHVANGSTNDGHPGVVEAGEAEPVVPASGPEQATDLGAIVAAMWIQTEERIHDLHQAGYSVDVFDRSHECSRIIGPCVLVVVHRGWPRDLGTGPEWGWSGEGRTLWEAVGQAYAQLHEGP